jgi:hypothetical protein
MGMWVFLVCCFSNGVLDDGLSLCGNFDVNGGWILGSGWPNGLDFGQWSCDGGGVVVSFVDCFSGVDGCGSEIGVCGDDEFGEDGATG